MRIFLKSAARDTVQVFCTHNKNKKQKYFSIFYFTSHIKTRKLFLKNKHKFHIGIILYKKGLVVVGDFVKNKNSTDVVKLYKWTNNFCELS